MRQLPSQLTRDAIKLVLELWASPTPGHCEQHSWRFNVPAPDTSIAKHVWLKPYQQPHPPIAVAGVSEKFDWTRSMTLLTTEVMPRLQHLKAP